MRPAQVVRRAAGYLSGHGVESSLSAAEILLANVLGTSRAGLYAREQILSAAEARAFGRALCLRCSDTPVQHITGEQAFRRLNLTVRPGVFIPRPETEILVDVAIRAIAGVDAPVVVDVCTGSGAVGLAIADEHPGARIWATDLSPDAVTLAEENADRLGITLHVRRGDLFSTLPEELRGTVDLVVANPPYVTPDEYGGLPADVRADPRLALVGGPEVLERLVAESAAWLRSGGTLAVEIGERHGTRACAALASAGYTGVEVVPDLAGRDRVVTARWP